MSQSVQASIDLGVVRLGDAIELAGRALVDQVEQPREAVAQIEAAAAAVTDVELPLHLRLDRGQVVVGRIAPGDRMAERRVEAALARGRRLRVLDVLGVSVMRS